MPRTRPIERILEEIPAAALVSPWASTRRPPEVRLRAETDQAYVIEVTAHAIDARFAPQIEADIRERMLSQSAGRRSNPGTAGGDAA